MSTLSTAFSSQQLLGHNSVVDLLFDSLQARSSGDQQILFNIAEDQLQAQISQIKTKHAQRFNAGQPAITLPLELLTLSLSFLDVNDQFSTIRVCQHWRKVIRSTPALWTRIEGIDNVSRFQFALTRAQNLPVDITRLRVRSPNDRRLSLATQHMHHIRVLGLWINGEFDVIRSNTAAHAMFTTIAPLLTRVTLTAAGGYARRFGPVDRPFSGIAPHLRSFELRRVYAPEFTLKLRDLQSVRTVSVSYDRIPTSFVGGLIPHFSALNTFNMELEAWEETVLPSPPFEPLLRQINIRWTGTTTMNPTTVIPQRDAWSSIPSIRVAHVPRTVKDTATEDQRGIAVGIPAAATPYAQVIVRSFGAPNLRMHIRAVDMDNRERIFCGLATRSISGMLARLQRDHVSTLSIGTTAAGIGFLTEARCPALTTLRLILDTTDLSWVVVFARDILYFNTLEQLEFAIDSDLPDGDWSNTVIMRVLGSCLASGSILLRVLFKGFSPDSACMAHMTPFAREVVTEPGWVDTDSERSWFTKPPFDWF